MLLNVCFQQMPGPHPKLSRAADRALLLARGVSSDLEALAQAQLVTEVQAMMGEASKHGS